ncbi:uncharacterized protein LOC124128670 isoform X2 [Haliotis rufescens]|uniref:uncharacterized protein LOC124128670 isoform X2 n=1 Tax=Haliotis rufescens TaxID=6454 RepID=UPI00201EF6A0|nr:uncharacterized protein LOC124128670 isoform X2 [Haliotis rufescens]
MFKFGVIVLLLGYSPKAFATDCTACKDTYVAARDTSGATDTQKCAALATYLTCLETSAKTDTGCPLPTADAAAIETGYGDFSCSGEAVFTATCNCQKEFWKTDQSANAAAICSAAKAYITCLKGKTDVACDGSTTVAALATGVETRITNLGSTDCTVTTACQCEINAAKADISDDAKKCTAYKAQFACLYSLTTAPCASGTTIDALRSAAATSVTSTTSCSVTTACQCEIDAAKADISTDAKKCTAYKAQYACLYPLATDPCAGGTTIDALKTAVANSVTTTTSCNFDTCVCQRTFDAATKETDEQKCTAYKAELSCLSTAQSTGCDGTTNKSAIATASESARALLPTGDCPALTSTCQCEVNAAKGDASTSATYCTVLTTLKTCLSAITTTTEAGCTSTTQADLLTDTNDKITAATCGSAADHVTFATTSLIVSVLVNMFL